MMNPALERPSRLDPFAIEKLEDIAEGLRLSGLCVAWSTTVNLFLLFTRAFATKERLVWIGGLETVSALLVGSTVCIAIWHDIRIRKGWALFEEISNEFEKLSIRNGGLADGLDADPAREARIVLRRFASNSDIPLVPGKFGPGVYALANFLILAALAWSGARTFGNT